MATKKSRNRRRNRRFWRKIFDEAEEFDESAEDLPIKDAEIIKETRRIETSDYEEDTFAKFLESLPEDSNPVILITRQPDRNSGMQFRTPCEGREQTGTLNWNSYTDASEIHADIAKRYGGGRYTIKIKDGQRLEKKPHLDNQHFRSAVFVRQRKKPRSKQKRTRTNNPEITKFRRRSQISRRRPPSSKNPLVEAIEQMKLLRDFENLVSPSREPVESPTATPAQPAITKETIKMALIEKALNNPDLVEKAIEAVFDIPPETAEQQGNTVVEVIKFAASHPNRNERIVRHRFVVSGNRFRRLSTEARADHSAGHSRRRAERLTAIQTRPAGCTNYADAGNAARSDAAAEKRDTGN